MVEKTEILIKNENPDTSVSIFTDNDITYSKTKIMECIKKQGVAELPDAFGNIWIISSNTLNKSVIQIKKTKIEENNYE